MPKTITQIIGDWKKVQDDIKVYMEKDSRDIKNARDAIRKTIISGKEINQKDTLAVLLKAEYELEREEARMVFTTDWIMEGKSVETPEFRYKLEAIETQNDLKSFDEDNIKYYRPVIREMVVMRNIVNHNDILGQLLLREYQNERSMMRHILEENYLKQGYDKDSKLFRHSVELDMLHADMVELNAEQLEAARAEFDEKKNTGNAIESENRYMQLLIREFQLEKDIEAIKAAEAQKAEEEKQRQEEIKRQEAEEAKKFQDGLVENLYTTAPEDPKKGFWGRIRDFFSRKPKEDPVAETPVAETPAAEEKTAETEKEEQEKETVKTGAEKEKQPEKELTEEEKKLQKEEAERQHRYQVEFAGKDLPPRIRNSSDPEVLKEYLKENKTLSALVKEHLEGRIAANEKINALEKARTGKQKKRPPCVQYKDGTILLKNKMKDMPKQTTINGCWSAVLSDMLAHFGAELTQEEIRAYRPGISPDAEKSNEAKLLMSRLNKDSVNELNDMADLIQRVVPNVAHHHMSIGTNREENKEVLKDKITDALLNKNSPVAIMYGNHYMSVVGIKNNTLIVQNSDPRFNTKYQKLAIDDLFNDGKGQVTLDWLEDLKFEKGTCKNINEQWKKMGIECENREFKAGNDKNQMSHVKGNEYYDTSRIEHGIEETIYMPKMSYGRELQQAETIQKENQQTPPTVKKDTKEIQQNDPTVKKDTLETEEPELDDGLPFMNAD